MEYFIHLAILFSIFAILAISLDLVVGYTGLLSVTHAAFYGIGAYAMGLLLTKTGLGFFLALGVGIVLSGVIALLIGLVLSKLRGDYYALCSIGFNVIVFSIFLNWQDVTRGPLGIPGIDRPEFFGFALSENILFLGFALLFFLLTYMIAEFLTTSSFGRAIQAIREDEDALSVFGYNVLGYKLVIFVVSAMLASVAGALFASYITFIDPSSFSINESIFVLAIIILGGLGSLRGAVLGALVLILLPEALRFVGFTPDIAAQMRQVIYGLILVLLMIYRPQGLLGKFRL